mgnify:CR=1 FL=1
MKRENRLILFQILWIFMKIVLNNIIKICFKSRQEVYYGSGKYKDK